MTERSNSAGCRARTPVKSCTCCLHDTPDATNAACKGGGSCLGDFDLSGSVDTVDLLTLLGQWGTAGPEADLDDSGEVDTVDLLMLLGAWGDCPKG